MFGQEKIVGLSYLFLNSIFCDNAVLVEIYEKYPTSHRQLEREGI